MWYVGVHARPTFNGHRCVERQGGCSVARETRRLVPVAKLTSNLRDRHSLLPLVQCFHAARRLSAAHREDLHLYSITSPAASHSIYRRLSHKFNDSSTEVDVLMKHFWTFLDDAACEKEKPFCSWNFLTFLVSRPGTVQQSICQASLIVFWQSKRE